MAHVLPDRSLRLLLNQLRAIRVLTHEEVVLLCAHMQQGGDEGERARATMIRHNLRLVMYIANKMAGKSGLDVMDLFQEGYEGLVLAVDGYDPKRGTFATYATWSIRNVMLRYMADHGATIRRSLNMIRKMRRLSNVEERLVNMRDGVTPGLAEVASEMGETQDTVCMLRQERWAAGCLPLDGPLGDGSDATLSELLPSQSTPVTHILFEGEQCAVIDRVLAMIRERYRYVLVARYGLHGTDQRTLREVAGEMGVTGERVRQLETVALKNLRDALDTRGYVKEDVL